MKHFKRIILIGISPFFLMLSAKSQTPDECKYLMVVTYLRTNTQINDNLKELFYRHDKRKRKQPYIEFNLSKKVEFIGLSLFKDSLLSEELDIKKEVVSNYYLYRDKYYFDKYESRFLAKLLDSNRSKLYLTFSRPVGNYVVAAMGNMNPEITGVNQYGLSMTMLFEFDSLGIISKVIYHGAAFR